MATPFDPGPAQEPFASLAAGLPGESVYPSADFRTEWGPVFHRGRLDGTARLLVVGQDPAQHETIARRILVGEAGHRLQGLLFKLGIERSYVMVNTFLFSVFGQAGGERHQADAAISRYRNRWLQAIFQSSPIVAVIALGHLADDAWQRFARTAAGKAVSPGYVHVTHPTQPESASRGDPTKHEQLIAAMLANWNAGMEAIAPSITTPDRRRALVPYGTAFADGDRKPIPQADLPAGSPAWMAVDDGWAARTGADAAAKRRSITVTVPAGVLSPVSEDRFDRAYLEGVLDGALAAPAPPAVRAIAAEPVALHGTVLTPDRVLDDGHVVIQLDGTVGAVQAAAPQGVRVHETGGVILPGLIDLHGHPEFNVFAAWEPPKVFANRYRWRDSDEYHSLIRDVQNELLAELPRQTQARYAEIRALVGGVTAIQGASAKYPKKEEALVRNVDLPVFGEQRARAMIDLPSKGSRDEPHLHDIVTQIGTGDVTAFYIHLAEGKRDDERSQGEFAKLTGFNALTKATVIIHGTALTRDQLGDVRDAGAKLVWSPQSNLRLYGETTLAADALELGVTLGLGADWLPSGSPSLLAEMQVARRWLRSEGSDPPAKRLVQMMTSDAAAIAGLQEHLGTLAEGRPADVLVLERRHDDPWESVLESDPSAVELVTIGGDLAYGRADWLGALADPAHVDRLEPVIAWGREMLLDTSYSVHPGATPSPTLGELRTALVAAYPRVGPIFA